MPMIYFYVKRPSKREPHSGQELVGHQWDEITFQPDQERQAARFWYSCLLQGVLVERVARRG